MSQSKRGLPRLVPTLLAGLLALTAVPALSETTKAGAVGEETATQDMRFTIAVIPDTQNYLDFRAQRAEGFPFDASEMFLDQMAFVSRHLRANGGTIDFVTAVGDVWQHLPGDRPDPEHAALGMQWVPSPALETAASPRYRGKILTVEIPAALTGYRMIADKVPFALVPGNHDYDAMWTDARHPPSAAAQAGAGRPSGLGILHLGGLDLWRGAFGSETAFFRGKPWYVSSFRHGADSAVVFTAAGRRFLHIGLEMQPDDAALDWARGVLAHYRGVPTIVTIHQYLKPDGTRGADEMLQLSVVQPAHNDPEALWTKFIAANDQIFLVLNGHEEGAARRVDRNRQGHEVHQLLSDYQGRRQSFRGAAPGDPRVDRMPGIGDGWLRLLDFDLTPGRERIKVRTYSTHYKAEARDLPAYAQWYKAAEHPGMSDAEFLDQDDFTIELKDFGSRFGNR